MVDKNSDYEEAEEEFKDLVREMAEDIEDDSFELHAYKGTRRGVMADEDGDEDTKVVEAVLQYGVEEDIDGGK